MINISELNSFPAHDVGSLTLLKEIAQKYCPEEAREIRQSVIPDEALHLEELEAGFRQLLAGGSGYGQLPYLGDTERLWADEHRIFIFHLTVVDLFHHY